METEPVSVSVVVPVYNGMPYLSKCVESVLTQLPDDGELVIRDNASTDGTSAWLRGLTDPRVRVLKAESTVPVFENWNLVLREARGRFVKLICADDELTDGALVRQVNALSKSGAAMVASRRNVVNARGRTVLRGHGLGRQMYGPLDGKEALRRAILSGTNSFGEPASVMFRREFAAQAGGFETEFPYVTDIDFYARVLLQGGFLGLSSVDATFRVSQSSWSSQIGKAQHREFVDWVNSLRSNNTITLSAGEAFLFRARSLLKFLLRRLASAIITIRG